MNESAVYLLKEGGNLLKDVFLVVFTYLFATKQAVKSKKNEIRLEEESDERGRIEEYHRQFPVVLAEMKSSNALLHSVASALEGLAEDNKITRKRLDHLAEVDDEMRQSNNRRLGHLETVVEDIRENTNGKFYSMNKQVQAIAQVIGEIEVRVPKPAIKPQSCPSGHFVPPLYEGLEVPTEED